VIQQPQVQFMAAMGKITRPAPMASALASAARTSLWLCGGLAWGV